MKESTPGRTPAWHLIAGSTGAGKTTYARELGKQTGGVVFSVDEWMNTLFWPDCPRKDDLLWALERVSRCEQQVAALGRQLALCSVPAIFDMGLTSRAARESWLPRARAASAALVLHVLDVAADLRWQRVAARNTDRSATFAFEVSRSMFDLVETMWERPSPEECALYTEVLWRA